jgi:hypothetical protein
VHGCSDLYNNVPEVGMGGNKHRHRNTDALENGNGYGYTENPPTTGVLYRRKWDPVTTIREREREREIMNLPELQNFPITF